MLDVRLHLRNKTRPITKNDEIQLFLKNNHIATLTI